LFPHVCGAAGTLPERLSLYGISIRPSLLAASAEAEFELVTNETTWRRPAAQIVANFL
jgi:hypothetical protein